MKIGPGGTGILPVHQTQAGSLCHHFSYKLLANAKCSKNETQLRLYRSIQVPCSVQYMLSKAKKKGG
jgi:hypothetical protein